MLELLCLGTLHMVDLCLFPLISPVCPGKPLCMLAGISLTLPFISHIRSKIAIIQELSIDEWYTQPCDLAFACLTFFCKVRTMAPSPFTLRKEKSQLQTECGQFENCRSTQMHARYSWLPLFEVAEDLLVPSVAGCPLPYGCCDSAPLRFLSCLTTSALKPHIMLWLFIFLSSNRCPRSGLQHGSVSRFTLRASRGYRDRVFPPVFSFISSFRLSRLNGQDLSFSSPTAWPQVNHVLYHQCFVTMRNTRNRTLVKKRGINVPLPQSHQPRDQVPQRGP